MWTGSRGALSPIVFCTFGNGPIEFTAFAGQTYYVMIGSEGPGGDLVFQEQQPADTDGDGIGDARDNCPVTPNPEQADGTATGEGTRATTACRSNPNQEDGDGDGIGDACEDDDADGWPNSRDNCPVVANSDQRDSDGDGRATCAVASPVHDLAIGVLNTPVVTVKLTEGGKGTLTLKLRLFNLVNYREQAMLGVQLSGIRPARTLTGTERDDDRAAAAGGEMLVDFAVACAPGTAKGVYALSVSSTIAHIGPGWSIATPPTTP